MNVESHKERKIPHTPLKKEREKGKGKGKKKSARFCNFLNEVRETMNELGKRSRKPNITKKEARRAVKMIAVQGMSPSKTMVALGYSPVTARTRPDKLTNNPTYLAEKNKLQEAILKKEPKYFEKNAQVFIDGLETKKVTHFAFEGVVQDSKVDVDMSTRIRAAELGARLFGYLKEKSEAGINVFNPQQFFLMVQQSEAERGLAEVEG